jgi:hypothetical protein
MDNTAQRAAKLATSQKRLLKSVPAVKQLLLVQKSWGCSDMAYCSLTLPFDHFRKVMAVLDADPALVEEFLTDLAARNEGEN